MIARRTRPTTAATASAGNRSRPSRRGRLRSVASGPSQAAGGCVNSVSAKVLLAPLGLEARCRDLVPGERDLVPGETRGPDPRSPIAGLHRMLPVHP